MDLDAILGIAGLIALADIVAGAIIGFVVARRRNKADEQALQEAHDFGYSGGWWDCRHAVEGLRLTDGDLSLIRLNLNRREAERSRGF